MVARMLGAAPTIADTIIEQLAAPFDKAIDAKVHALLLFCGHPWQQLYRMA